LRLFELPCSTEEKIELGARIGSDVPFFFCKSAALVEGRGEIFRAIDCVQSYYIVLLCPNFSISTPWAYANVKKFLTVPENFRNFDTCADDHSFWRLLEKFENNFEHVAFAHYQEYAIFREALLTAGAKKVLLSGSGSSIFGIFESEACAQEAMKLQLDCKKFLVHPVNSN